LYDDQNNAAGGYCKGPTMTFYEKSYLQLEWTNQHGCGAGHNNVDCDLIIQYMCDPLMRDGQTTDTITPATRDLKDASGNYQFGMHESYPNYRKCASRDRNGGLFTADQGNLGQGAKATQTRQDNNGNNNQHGFECAEERDYYPYWHPSPFKDIVIFTSNVARCPYFQKHSQNVMDKFWCESDDTDSATVEQFNNEKACGQLYWKKVEAWNIETPKCYPTGWNRDNHLGNGLGGYANTYKWILPTMDEIGAKNWIVDPKDNSPVDDLLKRKVAPCIVRIRYNISSGDFRGGVENDGPSYAQGGYVDKSFNGKEQSPVTTDPYIEYGKPYGSQDQPWHLRLAIDTSQFARTFQDRSHLFYITHLPLGHFGPIYNLGVRGKRGNIVQTYPATEYDFTPNDLKVNLGDFIHFQWTGCDTNPAGNDGEGRQQTDRSNFVLQRETANTGRVNYPKLFLAVDIWGDTGSKYAQDLTFKMAYINQYGGKQCQTQTETQCCLTLAQLNAVGGDTTQNIQNCGLLNADGANYFNGGLVKMIKAGVYNYMSTRNNNFTNRSQKGTVTVSSALSPFALTATIAGSAGFAGAATIAGGSWYASTHPESSVANCFANVKA
jgi:hypothetical protein